MQTDNFDPYAVLQVSPTADVKVIRAAHRVLALAHHPDRSNDPGAGARMARINAARDLLASSERRAAYDQEATLQAQSTPASRAAARRAATPEWRVGPDGHHGQALGSILDFGRYLGWSLGEVARVNMPYLEWLVRAQGGRTYRNEICRLIAEAKTRSTPVPVTAPARKRRFGF